MLNDSRRLSVFFLIATLLFSTITFTQVNAGTTLSTIDNLSSDASNSKQPDIYALGSKVYVVWYDSTTNFIRFTNSTDSGVNFPDDIKVGVTDSGGTAATFPHPQVTADGTNVFVVWHDNGNINFTKSTDNGLSFPKGTDIGDSTSTKNAQLRITNSTEGDVYVTWIDGSNDIRFTASSDNGDSFPAASDIGNAGGNQFLNIAVNSTKGVYVTWVDDTNSVLVSSSDDSGATFGTAQLDIGDGDASNTIVQPSIAANATNVYVAWKNEDTIRFKRSTDGGASFSSPTTPSEGDLGSITRFDFGLQGPKVVVGSGGNVYVVWNDSGEIKLRQSTDSGATFATEQNISITSGVVSSQTQIAASGNSAYIIWQEADSGGDGNDKDIRLNSTNDNGASFSSFTDLSSNTQFATAPKLFALGSNASIVWEEKTGGSGTDGEIQFLVATITPLNVNFDSSQYRLSETATITVTDADSNTDANSKQTINVPITSATDGGGITLSFDETDVDTGIFTNTITFTSGQGSESSTTNRILNVTTGDAISASFSGVSGSASIFPRLVVFNADGYNLGEVAHLVVTDENSNLNSLVAETITVTITSKNTSDEVTLTLTETGVNDGVFGTNTNNDLILMNGNFLIPLGRSVTITEIENGNNPDAAAIDQRTVTVISDTDATVRNIVLTETGVNTNIYTGALTVISGTPGTNEVKASVCDRVIITESTGDLKTNAFVTTCTDNTKAAIQLSVTTALSDVITATYQGAQDAEIVSFAGGESGGGGGGLVRPSLVLDALAGASSVFGGGGRGAAPVLSLKVLSQSTFMAMPDVIEESIINFDPFTPLEPFDVNAEEFETFDFPFSIDNDGYAIAGYSNTLDTKTLNTGEDTKIKTVFYMPFELEHVAFYTNIRKGDSLDDSDAFLRFYTSKPDLNQVKDENGFFEYIKLTIEEDGIKKTATFDMKFLKPMPKSDIVLRMWDDKLHSTTVLIFDAIEVVGPTLEPVEEPAPEDLEIPEPGTTTPETSELRIEEPLTAVPDWIKTSAKWWNDEQISDTGFARGIEYLIENNILKVPQTETFEQVQEIPGWIKNTAGWWGDGLLPDQDFVNGIQWLIKNGIMKIQINS